MCCVNILITADTESLLAAPHNDSNVFSFQVECPQFYILQDTSNDELCLVRGEQRTQDEQLHTRVSGTKSVNIL